LTEASLLTGIQPEQAIRSFEQSGTFLTHYRETGCLSNHLAISALALYNLYLLTNAITWRDTSFRIVKELKKLQHDEGWFPEYEGCDLGYQTVTVEFLARLYQKSGDVDVLAMLKKNVQFLLNFVHPDGSLGGEYGSRNTYNFYPGGFAVLSNELPDAALMLGHFLRGLENGASLHLEDDGVFGHLLSSYVTALGCPKAKADDSDIPALKQGIRYFSGAGLFCGGCEDLSIFGTGTKGGVYKIFKNGALLNSDTGFIGKTADGKIFYQNKPRSARAEVENLRIRISGDFYAYKQKKLSRLQMIVLRVLSLFVGQWWKGYSNFIRGAMQKLLILGRKRAGISFLRSIEIQGKEIIVTDEIIPEKGVRIEHLERTTDCVDMHVITSNAFQLANLLPWEPCSMDTPDTPLKFQKRYI
jgi:hypothetical protein